MVAYGIAKARAMANRTDWNERTEITKAIITWVDSEYEYELEIENDDHMDDEEFKAWIEKNAEEFAKEDAEENGTTFEENALIKARAIMKLTGQITMADDSGLEIDYLNKAPGVYSARFMGHDTSYDIKNKALIQKLEGVKGSDRSGRFVCAIAVCFPDGREIVKRGTMEGLIAEEIKGDNGFGYDPIVYLPEYGKTSGELAPEEKNKISHRGKALALIKEELDKSEELYAEDNDSK